VEAKLMNGSAAAVAFLDRAEQDAAFAADLESARHDPDSVLEKVRAAGFDVSEDEISHAFADRYGVELTPEQLSAIAAGLEIEWILLLASVGGAAVGGAAGAAAAA
jgi:predicted ribosomally synthesized peptide with nif11-like leader